MALNKTALSAAIKAKISVGENILDDSQLTKFCDAIADSVVDHIIANAEVATTVAVTGVTVGAGAAAGTGTGTIS